MLRGAEENQRYQLDADGIPRALGAATLLEAGQVEKVSADDGDIHRVSNALADRVSISIHVYGGNIGAVKRAVYTRKGSRNRLSPATLTAIYPISGIPPANIKDNHYAHLRLSPGRRDPPGAARPS